MYMVMAPVIIGLSMLNLAAVGLQADDFYVHDLPLLPTKASSIRMHAAQIPISPKCDGALFFWPFASKNLVDRSKTVIWLNGGPGCSNLHGAWLGISPFRFQDKDTMIENDGSWVGMCSVGVLTTDLHRRCVQWSTDYTDTVSSGAPTCTDTAHP
ncbi:unnamed protein product [Rotaria magnacalcarata]|uniref:Uncharacterized protein n=3 Tax=Rotaria magnacalcarata TaxID=392030 RepID=A0A816NBW9_9BILA|nr:unnamed protein product [Rotaria magnacalcarata]